MDIVLGVSLTPKTVRLVLVEGAKADGAIVDHDTFDLWSTEDTANLSAADQLVAAVLGTRESAVEGGHELKAVGVAWTDRATAAELRDALAARGVTDVMLVSELHAAGALAQAAGLAVGYESTGLLFVDRDTATLSVVRSDDGSIVKVLSRSLHATDAMAVLAEMVAAVEAQDEPPQGMFVVGSGVDIASVKEHLTSLVSMPVNAPDESGLALARGAALAAASAPPFDAATVGLAYSQDPDGATAGNAFVGLAGAATQMAPFGADVALVADNFMDQPIDDKRKPFLLVGSALTSLFVIGVVGLVITLAVNIRPTVEERPDAGRSAIIPNVGAPSPAIVEALPTVAVPPAAIPLPPAETIKPPAPVVQQAPAPRPFVAAPAPRAPAPQVPVQLAPAPPPVAPVLPPPVAPVLPPPVAPVLPPPVYVPPPVYQPPPVYNPSPGIFFPPIFRPPWRQEPPRYPPPPPPQYPSQGYPPYPPAQNPGQFPFPASENEDQAPQYPWPPSGSNGSNGGGHNRHNDDDDNDGGSHGSGNAPCLLLLCLGGGRH